MSLSINNVAHRTLFLVSVQIHMHRGGKVMTFDQVAKKPWPVRYLIDYNPGDTPETERTKAEKTAAFYSGMFEGYYGATSQTGISSEKIIEQFAAHLADSNNDLATFAEVVDNLYMFRGETL